MRNRCVIAFAFGTPETIQSNRTIALIASNKARKLNIPVYTQRDIRVDRGVWAVYTDEEIGNPPPTLRIAREGVKWAKAHNFTEMWVAAAKPHLWRTMRDVREAVREAGAKIEVRECEEIEQYPKDSWFCADSTQERVCSREAWEKREKWLKRMPFWIYKHIAK